MEVDVGYDSALHMKWNYYLKGFVAMVHYTCDCCKGPIDVENSIRYIVRLEVYASLDPIEEDLNSDRDHLLEIQEILENLDDAEDTQVCDEVYHHARYDLCSKCRQRYVKNPLGRLTTQHLKFSKN